MRHLHPATYRPAPRVLKDRVLGHRPAGRSYPAAYRPAPRVLKDEQGSSGDGRRAYPAAYRPAPRVLKVGDTRDWAVRLWPACNLSTRT